MQKEMLEKYAVEGARKICGVADCTYGHNCGHVNKASQQMLVPLIGELKECPLAKYNIRPMDAEKPWYQTPYNERFPTREEIFSLCWLCEHAERKFDDNVEEAVVVRTNLRNCCDCPVKGAEEYLDETEAEGDC